MYRTDFVENTDNSGILEFISEREEAIRTLEKRSRKMKVAYIGAITLCVFITAYLGYFAQLF